MGANAKSRLIAVMVAVVMIMTSAVGVFASSKSVEQGSNNANNVSSNIGKGTITVDTEGKITATTKGKISGDAVKKLKNGDLVVITTSEGKTYKWLKTVKVKKVSKKKITWKKVKGASWYCVQIKKGGKTTYKKVKGTSCKVPKGAKVRVRPLKKKGGHVYVGVLCKSKKVK